VREAKEYPILFFMQVLVRRGPTTGPILSVHETAEVDSGGVARQDRGVSWPP